MPLDLEAVGGDSASQRNHSAHLAHNHPKRADGLDRCMAALEENKIEALIAIGGDDTLSVAEKLPCTPGAESSGCSRRLSTTISVEPITPLGFDTACNIVCGGPRPGSQLPRKLIIA